MATSTLADQVNSACQTTPRTSQSLVGPMLTVAGWQWYEPCPLAMRQIAPPRPGHGAPFPETGSDGYAVFRRAHTSISIFMRGSARPHMSMVAAGRTSPNARRSVGQQGSKSARSGSR